MDTSKQFNLMLEKAMLCEPKAFMEFGVNANVQDQLQEMMLERFRQQEGGYYPTFWLLHKFEHWLPNCRYGDTSMEQLWLDLVMSELYQKMCDFDKEDWIETRQI